EKRTYINVWETYKAEHHVITKFVPASGAASRMFKDMFAFIDADYDEPTTAFEKKFFAKIKKFAFYDELCKTCKALYAKDVDELIGAKEYKKVASAMLGSEGMNYGKLPKGLLLFHKYAAGARTPLEEHLVEAALYASSAGVANIHFTVSAEHKELFKKLVSEKANEYSEKFGVKYNISFSEQKSSTDTIAATVDNKPFRTADGKLLFRPGGHGALIENLNDIDSDVVFIKNIDNVVPDSLKGDTVEYKQVIAGILVSLQKKAFEYLKKLESGEYSHSELEEMIRFLQNDLCCRNQEIKHFEDSELVIYLKKKFNRPMRVCGVVKNVGEPGGGPFLVQNEDGSVSLQILESSQINMADEKSKKMFENGSYFNPVDLVCATKDKDGKRFDLLKYVDKKAGFISQKSKDGKELKALELPGLWNGAMSDWNTVFVEVPLSTFNPVKTVNDLLREQHQ
ncbi:MAG: DUF4301 family protein, partial [Bacteroidaceae bacterium]|nr:DUF4301 family protein [Bacteroidaceae bacterium]